MGAQFPVSLVKSRLDPGYLRCIHRGVGQTDQRLCYRNKLSLTSKRLDTQTNVFLPHTAHPTWASRGLHSTCALRDPGSGSLHHLAAAPSETGGLWRQVTHDEKTESHRGAVMATPEVTNRICTHIPFVRTQASRPRPSKRGWEMQGSLRIISKHCFCYTRTVMGKIN